MLCLIIQNCRTSSKSRMTSSRSKEGKCESLNGIEWMLVASVSIKPAISYVIQPNKPHFFELPECVFLLSLSRYRSIRNKGKQSPTWISISPRMKSHIAARGGFPYTTHEFLSSLHTICIDFTKNGSTERVRRIRSCVLMGSSLRCLDFRTNPRKSLVRSITTTASLHKKNRKHSQMMKRKEGR